MSTRDLYLALRVRDEGTRVMTRFSRELSRSGTAARAASLRAQADALRERASIKQTEIATERLALAKLREASATRAQIAGKLAVIQGLNKESIALNKQAGVLDRQATALQRSSIRMEHMANIATQAGTAFQTLGVALAGVGVIGLYGLKQATDVAVEYQRQVALTKTQVDGFIASQKDLSDMGLRVAKSIALPFEEIQPMLYDIFSTTNANMSQAELLMTAFAKTAVAGQVKVQDAARLTMGVMNAFHIPLEDVNKVLDIQFELVRKGAGTYGEFSKTLGRAVSAAVRANQSFDTLAGMVAYLTRTQAISTAMAATASARALEALSNPKAIGAMEAMGVKVKDAKGNMRNLVDVLGQLHDKLQKLPVKGRLEQVKTLMGIFKGAGGTIQARRFLEQVLLGKGDFEEFKKIVKSVKGSSGEFEKAYAEMATTTASKTQLIKNKWKVVAETIGEILLPVLGKLLDFLGKIADAWNNLSPGTKSAITNFLLIGSILALVAGLGFVAVGMFAIFLAAIMSLGGPMLLVIGGLGILAGMVAGVGVALFIAYQKSQAFRDLVAGLGQIISDLWHGIEDFAISVYNSFMTYVMPPLRDLWDLIQRQVIPAFEIFMTTVWEKLKPKLEEAGRILKDYVAVAFQQTGKIIRDDLIPAIMGLVDWWARNKQYIMPFIDILAQLVKWFLIVVGVILISVIPAMAIMFAGSITIVLGFLKLLVWSIKGTIAVIQAIAKWLISAGQAVGKFFSDLWHSITSTFGKVVASFGDLKSKITGAVAGFGTLLANAGVDLIRGLIGGISSMAGQVTGAIGNVVSGAIAAAKNALGSHSPSKVFMKIGVDTAEGYIIGFQKKLRKPPTPPIPSNFQVATSASEAARVGSRGPNGGPSTGMSKVINNTFNITTNDEDPKATAAKLGWELAGRM